MVYTTESPGRKTPPTTGFPQALQSTPLSLGAAGHIIGVAYSEADNPPYVTFGRGRGLIAGGMGKTSGQGSRRTPCPDDHGRLNAEGKIARRRPVYNPLRPPPAMPANRPAKSPGRRSSPVSLLGLGQVRQKVAPAPGAPDPGTSCMWAASPARPAARPRASAGPSSTRAAGCTSGASASGASSNLGVGKASHRPRVRCESEFAALLQPTKKSGRTPGR
jgi:hypothetical protein